MANYIRGLQAQLEAARAEAAALRAAVAEFRIYLLTSPKFGNRDVAASAWDGDGLPVWPAAEPAERVDWISTSEAVLRLQAIESVGTE